MRCAGASKSMDPIRFDRLAKAISSSGTRRGMLRLLVGSAFGALLALAAGIVETEAHNKLKKCKKIADKDKRQKCRKKAKRHKRRHADRACDPACATGQDCLANGSCATRCTGSPDICPSPACFCGDPSTEGPRYCSAGNTFCEAHSTCGSTATCPRGEQCAPCNGTPRCLPLCPI